MQRNVVLCDQKQIFLNLLEETIREHASQPERKSDDIVIGANENVFSFRNSGRGIIAGKIACGVLPNQDGVDPQETISPWYNLNQYFGADLFELHSFHNHEGSVLILEDEERKSFSVYPDESAPEGILIHIEWKTELAPENILTERDVFHALLKMFPLNAKYARLHWEPVVWFNSNRILY
jgi:hypothetical protein